MSDKVAYIGCEMCVSERVRQVGIGCAGLLPDKTHHLDPKVPAVVVTNYESVNEDSRVGQAMPLYEGMLRQGRSWHTHREMPSGTRGGRKQGPSRLAERSSSARSEERSK